MSQILDHNTRTYLKQQLDAQKRSTLKHAARATKPSGNSPGLPQSSPARCQEVLGPFSARPGDICGRPLMAEHPWCGIHNPDRLK
jgi:hypothetical protein